MRNLALVVVLLTGCIEDKPEVTLSQLTELEFVTGGSALVVVLSHTYSIDRCAVPPADTHAELDGVAMEVVDMSGCDYPRLRSGQALTVAASHRLTLADSTRTITLELGDRLTPRAVTKVPAGPLDLVAGETYTFQTNVPADLERGLNVALRGGAEILSLTPVSGTGGMFTVTMPMREFSGSFDAWTGAQSNAPVVVGGVSCRLPSDSHFASLAVTVTLP